MYNSISVQDGNNKRHSKNNHIVLCGVWGFFFLRDNILHKMGAVHGLQEAPLLLNSKEKQSCSSVSMSCHMAAVRWAGPGGEETQGCSA